jgi:peptidyl-prolyl cis-trans isomerase B (cyclophilin B)
MTNKPKLEYHNYSFFLLTVLLMSCQFNSKSTKETEYKAVNIEMVTDVGNIVFQLYDSTPYHRDNMIKKVNEGYYDGLSFHRVVNKFGIQTGDSNTRLGDEYELINEEKSISTLPAEIHTGFYHKRGALNAARISNPERVSSTTQFFIVQGKIHADSTLDRAEKGINRLLAKHYFLQDENNKGLANSIKDAIQAEEWELYSELCDSVRKMAKSYDNFERYMIPDKHRDVYKTIGGAPHLDQNFTVFGEVIKGMDVVDSIAAMQVDLLDRPINDIRIRSMRVIASDI